MILTKRKTTLNPDGVLLDRRWRVGKGRLRAGDYQHVGEVGDADPQDTNRLDLSLFAECLPAVSADPKGFERAGISFASVRCALRWVASVIRQSSASMATAGP